MNRKHIARLAALALVGMSAPSMAGLFIEDGQSDCAECARQNAASDRHVWRDAEGVVVRLEGAESAQNPAPYSGYGDEMSLKDSLELVVPEGWRISAADAVALDSEVSWRAEDGTWLDALFAVAREADVVTTVSWPERRVRVAESFTVPGAPGSMTADAEAANSGDAAADADTDTAATPRGTDTAATGEGGTNTPTVYHLPAGELLSEALDEYVRAKGWQGVVWKIDEHYRIAQPLPMKGPVVEAVTELIRAYQRQGGLQGVEPLFARTNRMVVIRPMDLAAPQTRPAK